MQLNKIELSDKIYEIRQMLLQSSTHAIKTPNIENIDSPIKSSGKLGSYLIMVLNHHYFSMEQLAKKREISNDSLKFHAERHNELIEFFFDNKQPNK